MPRTWKSTLICASMEPSIRSLHAAENGMRKLVADLIKEGADVNGKNHRGWTSLHTASFYGHAAVVQTLREHGATQLQRTESPIPKQ